MGQLNTILIADVAEALAQDWQKLPKPARNEIRWAAEYMEKLLLRSAAGGNIEEELMGLAAIVANWSFTGSSAAERAFWSRVKTVMEVAAQVVTEVAFVALDRLV